MGITPKKITISFTPTEVNAILKEHLLKEGLMADGDSAQFNPIIQDVGDDRFGYTSKALTEYQVVINRNNS